MVDGRGSMRKGVIAAVVLVLLGVLVWALRTVEVTPERDAALDNRTASMVRPETESAPDEPATDVGQDAPKLATAPVTPEIEAPAPSAPLEQTPAPSAPEPPSSQPAPVGPDETVSELREPAQSAEATDRDEEAAATPGDPSAPEPANADTPAQMATLTPATGAAPADAESSGEAGKKTPTPDPEAPVFDLVRVSPDGQVVIAGKARPGAMVEVVLEGEVIGSAETDASGAFVAVLEAGTSGEARQLMLRVARNAPSTDPTSESAEQTLTEPDPARTALTDTDTAGPQASADTAPPEATEPEIPAITEGEPSAPAIDAAAAPDITTATLGRADRTEAAPAAEAPGDDRTVVATLDPTAGSADPGYAFSAPIIILPSADPGEAPVLVSPGRETLEVVQPSMAAAVDGLALDRITYEAGGDVVAAGRGREESAVRTYANGRLVAEAEVADTGGWQATIPRQVAEDTALLRFDEVSASGNVTGRLEAPFDYAGEGAVQKLRQRQIVIQRGNNLWRIAEQHYGEGIRYSVIFGANADLIRDPDLIYPDQVFTIPELVESE